MTVRDDQGYGPAPIKHRTLFLSDLHLGAMGCRADLIHDFLMRNTADTIYLVGDILDIWHPIVPHWTRDHDAVLSLLFRRVREGVRVIYTPGNHDAEMRSHYGLPLPGFEIVEDCVHVAADGRQFYVLHGDVCDPRILRWHVATRMGSRANHLLRSLDGWLKRARRDVPGTPERTVIEVVLGWVNAALLFGNRFEERPIELARARGLGGVICGHFHQARLRRTEDDILYANCGDWMDSFTALAETADGELRLIEWAEQAAPAPAAGLVPGAQGA